MKLHIPQLDMQLGFKLALLYKKSGIEFSYIDNNVRNIIGKKLKKFRGTAVNTVLLS